MIAVGIDVSLRRGFDVVAVDHRGRVAAPTPCRVPDAGGLDRVLRSLTPDAVGIDGPPAFGRPPQRSRPAEVELRRLGIISYSTPSDPAVFDHPFYGWMHAAHTAFAVAAAAGYPLYRGGPPAGHAAEVFPHAVAVALAGALPPAGCSRSTTRKRAWRVGLLRRAGVETTRLRSLDAVDAALAAYAMVEALAGRAFTVGEADGMVVLPGPRPAGPYPRAT